MSTNFSFLPEHNDILEQIVVDDVVSSEWLLLRDIIKYKIKENTSLFLSTADAPPAPSHLLTVLVASTPGGLKLPPFPPRQINQLTMNNPPVSYMSPEQAAQMQGYILNQLDEFDSTPFTIQRVCELCLKPQQHYKSVGKYLRAVEKALLVTSTWESFPPLSEKEMESATKGLVTTPATTSISVPSTPLFSPIPFLHGDARRSQSRSPPPSPLSLGTVGPPLPTEPLDTLESRALGLVDELDDPSPGHMSEHPVALTAVTDLPEARPVVGTLQDRFVKGDTDMKEGDSDILVDDDKENEP